MTAIEPTSALIGYSVRTRRGDDLGAVADFILDAELTRVRYAIVSLHAGFLHLRHKEYAIPFDALDLDTENECFVTDLTEDALRDARELVDGDTTERPPGAYRYHGIDTIRRGAP